MIATRLVRISLAVGLVTAVLGDVELRAEEWKGSYANSKGDKITDSTITFNKNGLSDGDWDGFAIFDLEISKDKTTRTWAHYAKFGDNQMKLYKVTAKKKGNTYSVSYEVHKRLVVQGKLQDGAELLYKGNGTFTAAPEKKE
jgi:hypothetical protein